MADSPGFDSNKPFGSGFGAGPGPYTTGPGVQSGQLQGQFQGVDFTQVGPAESYLKNNSSVWQSPSYGEVNNIGLASHYSDPNNRPQVTNNSQQWFDQYQGQMPSISSEPGFGAYYDNAKTRAAESIDQAAGARGNYGSSAAIDQNARAFSDLEGQRALNEADYNLKRLGEQRAWQGLGGNLAGQADQNSLATSQNEQSWANLLSKLGLDASQLGLQRTNSGMDAANAAQAAERARGQDYFSNQMAMGDRFAELMKSILQPALDNDASLAESQISGGVAQGNNAAATDRQNQQDLMSGAQSAAEVYDALHNGY